MYFDLKIKEKKLKMKNSITIDIRMLRYSKVSKQVLLRYLKYRLKKSAQQISKSDAYKKV